MDSGALVSDDIIIGLVKERMAQPDCAKGFLFDGFPRTIPQADAMKAAGVKLDYVLEIDVPFRRHHRAHERAPLAPGVRAAPTTSSSTRPRSRARTTSPAKPLIQREDDKEETVRKRLEVYSQQTRPLVDYYSDWAKADPAARRSTARSAASARSTKSPSARCAALLTRA